MDHPRSRGEYVPEPVAGLEGDGSSPLSRGIPADDWPNPQARRIIPALAGNTMSLPPATHCPQDHPRSRGEYGRDLPAPVLAEGSSPLSRGIPSLRCPSHQPIGIIPALAGNTLPRAGRPGLPGDHPRSRGEYHAGDDARAIGRGSSPLSRGIHHLVINDFDPAGIIPALAGNTTPPHPAGRKPWIIPALAGNTGWGFSC